MNNKLTAKSSTKKFEYIVVGGGITGASAAYYLSKSGADVALLEKSDLNTQASGRNAGSLHGQIQFEPFEQLGIDWAKSFLPALSFLADSVKVWSTLSGELDTDLETSFHGGIMVAETEEDLRRLHTKVVLEKSVGIDSALLNKDELHAKAPYVSKKMIGAAFCPIEGKANPLLATPAFARQARINGAAIRTGVELLHAQKQGGGFSLTTSEGEYLCKKLVLTSGEALSKLSQSPGVTLPIVDGPVQVSVTEQLEKFVNYLFYFTGGKLTLKQAKSGSLLIGGGWPALVDKNGLASLSPESLRSNLGVALKVVPALSSVKVIRTWIGVGNETPDHRPILGQIPGTPGAFFGIFPAMGFSAGPLMGQTLSELALTDKASRDLSKFALERFE